MRKNEKKTTGGIIVAAGKSSKRISSDPLLKIGSITIIKRIVLTLQGASISPIVIITGYKAEEIERDLANYGVIFLKNNQYENSRKFDSAKIGLDFLQNKCDQVIFTPVSIPMFTTETLQTMIECGKGLVSPSYHGKSGHPLLISSELIPRILKYDGNIGMRGAIKNIGVTREWIDVEDEGIIYDTDYIDQLDQLLIKHNQRILHPFVKISIEKESSFFDSRAKLLLILINDKNSVRGACRHMALSYSKAWNMLNQLEEELGYAVVERKHGGSKGGKTCLTKEGLEFLKKYQQFEENVRQYAKDEFERLF
ncbi:MULTISPECIES: NTP transferase domain-containing protein [Clostridium]|uniref:NTP transferase domain-containing protein n=1 Tax=Clostridium aquiflavi TaxID=3073603 RepID=A0ABU1EDD0_9CLOT|nr:MULTISPECIES: NTP transferase domain-containing protein [unclassified Clostridium]MDR5586380.1 NTP transferase domain-containing protein [Clostridium sp. 5N-1]NFG61380.1 LysR family transcriptional regulator [Clostridium botulinum]NFQ09149.1 LysR family transcriptional regulator [Clostridium botulinum]